MSPNRSTNNSCLSDIKKKAAPKDSTQAQFIGPLSGVCSKIQILIPILNSNFIEK